MHLPWVLEIGSYLRNHVIAPLTSPTETPDLRTEASPEQSSGMSITSAHVTSAKREDIPPVTSRTLTEQVEPGGTAQLRLNGTFCKN